MKMYKIFIFFTLLLFSCNNNLANKNAKMESLKVCGVDVDLSISETKIIVPSLYLIIEEKDIDAKFNIANIEAKIIGKNLSLSDEEYIPLKIAVVDTKAKKIAFNYVVQVKKAKQFNVIFEAPSLEGRIKAEIDGKELMSPAIVDEGAKINFYAIPNDKDLRVANWQQNDSPLNIYSKNYTTTINSDINISVSFKRGYRVFYNESLAKGKIEVSKGGSSIAKGEIVEKNTILKVKVIPNESYLFDYWIINGKKKLYGIDYRNEEFSFELNEDVNIDASISMQGTLEIGESNTDQMKELHLNGVVHFPLHYQDSKIGAIEKSFAIAKYQVTYKLWNEVLEWAKERQYLIASGKGSKGAYYNDGNDGKTKGMHENVMGSEEQPVVLIDYRSIIVWCNAYSEKMGKTPVYYSDSEFKNAIKISNDEDVDSIMGTQDNPYINENADGYRLPSLCEWECVARLNKSIGSETVKVGNETWHFLPFDYASGAIDKYTNIEELKKVAWFEGNSQVDGKEQTHDVGKLKANDAGCFDMSGNVYEMMEDWSQEKISRFIKGGSFSASFMPQAIGLYSGINLEDALRGVGFRLSRTLK